jgi:hypothetical protein
MSAYLKRSILMLVSMSICGLTGAAQQSAANIHNPTWWTKYQRLLANGPADAVSAGLSLLVGANVDVSNECGPQSETYITLDTSAPTQLAAGSNEIFRLPMRGYFSSDGGTTWGGVDLPLPPAIGTNGTRFGSDPSLAFDSLGNVFYSYIVVFFSANFGGINGTQLAVARSTDGGRTYPASRANFFAFEGGENHFNDKPMITADTNIGSPFLDNVYVAWDAAVGGSTGGGIRVARSSDHGDSFAINRADDPRGPGRAIGAVPFVGPNGDLYVAWNDYSANTITMNHSADGGASWGMPIVISRKTIPFDIAIAAESFRGALVYPACDVDRSSGPHRGRLYCSWMDLNVQRATDIYASFSDDRGSTWSARRPVTDQISSPVDRFNHWLSVDAVTGDVNVSFYDTRNDPARVRTDTFFSQSRDGGLTWTNVRLTGSPSNEHDCGGIFPCAGIDYGNQQGDYEGLVSFGGSSHPVWTDSRLQLSAATGCRTGLAMEEVFTTTVVR